MEAMACECCPVATRVGGNPELIADGENGRLFEVDNAAELAGWLQQLLEDKATRKRYAAAAKARMASEFTPQKAANAMQEIYGAVLHSTRVRR
jgi:glycosyltransferase involved in cell wall biosynthesis